METLPTFYKTVSITNSEWLQMLTKFNNQWILSNINRVNKSNFYDPKVRRF